MKNLLLLITLVVGVIAFALPAQANTLTFHLDTKFNGAASTPTITAIFDDSYGGSKNVRLTMSAGVLGGNKYIDDWLFNFDDTLNVYELTFTPVGTPGSEPTINQEGMNFYQADGDGFYDIEFNFPTDSSERFTSDETVVYDISYISNIDVFKFNYGSTPPTTGDNPGPYNSAAHINGWIGNSEPGEVGNGGSGSSGAIPEPATMLLLGSGLIGLAVSGKKRFKKRNG